jgi:hypothetical protein
MSEAMNPMDPARPMEQGTPSTSNVQNTQGTPVTPNDPGAPMTSRPVSQGTSARSTNQGGSVMAMNQGEPLSLQRPGLVTFAAVMLFIVGGFELVWAIVELVNAAWISSVTYGTFNGYLWLWGILDLILAAAIFYAAYDILRGGAFGRIFGVIVAGISAVRWFFYIPAQPWLSIVAIAVDILVIYALVGHSEYFDAADLRS